MPAMAPKLFTLLASIFLASVLGDAADTSCNATEEDGQSLLQHKEQSKERRQRKFLPTEIRRNYINVNGVQYSRKGAESADLGRVAALTLLGVPPTVDFETPAPSAWLTDNVMEPTIADITSSQEFELGISASVEVSGFEASGELNIEDSHSASMTIQKLEINDEWKILMWFNDPDNSAWVAQYRRLQYPRIVMAIWVLVDQNVPEIGHQCFGGSLSVRYSGAGGSITGQGCGDSQWTFNSGTEVAYRLGIVNFDRDGNALRITEDIGTR